MLIICKSRATPNWEDCKLTKSTRKDKFPLWEQKLSTWAHCIPALNMQTKLKEELKFGSLEASSEIMIFLEKQNKGDVDLCPQKYVVRIGPEF